VKISAPYRSSTLAPDFPDIAPIARAMVAANPQRILWGSDWPHPGIPVPGRSNAEITPFFQIDDGRVLNFSSPNGFQIRPSAGQSWLKIQPSSTVSEWNRLQPVCFSHLRA